MTLKVNSYILMLLYKARRVYLNIKIHTEKHSNENFNTKWS